MSQTMFDRMKDSKGKVASNHMVAYRQQVIEVPMPTRKSNGWLYVALFLLFLLIVGGSYAAIRAFGISVNAIESAPTVAAPVTSSGSAATRRNTSNAQSAPQAAPTVAAPIVPATDNGAIAIPTPDVAYQEVITSQADHSPRGNPVEAVSADPVVVDNGAVQEQPKVVESAPVEAPQAIIQPTSNAAVAASYANRTQDRCSMPRANPATCKAPMPAMATPVGNP